jgi:hypothetical protein
MTTETQNNHNSAPPKHPTTSEDVAFWACLVISQIWGSWSIGKGGVAVFASVPWLVMAFALRWPYWKRLLNDKRA